MITPLHLATEVSAAGERFIETLNRFLSEAEVSCSAEEYEQFKVAVGSVIGILDTRMLLPIYRKHPELEPESLRDLNNET